MEINKGLNLKLSKVFFRNKHKKTIFSLRPIDRNASSFRWENYEAKYFDTCDLKCTNHKKELRTVW